jgi:hypothetical protein
MAGRLQLPPLLMPCLPRPKPCSNGTLALMIADGEGMPE